VAACLSALVSGLAAEHERLLSSLGNLEEENHRLASQLDELLSVSTATGAALDEQDFVLRDVGRQLPREFQPCVGHGSQPPQASQIIPAEEMPEQPHASSALGPNAGREPPEGPAAAGAQLGAGQRREQSEVSTEPSVLEEECFITTSSTSVRLMPVVGPHELGAMEQTRQQEAAARGAEPEDDNEKFEYLARRANSYGMDSSNALAVDRRLSLASRGSSKSNRKESLPLWPAWASGRHTPLIRDATGSTSLVQAMTATLSTVRGDGMVKDDTSCLQRIVASPTSMRRIVWDIVSVFVIGYDVLTVPLVAFSEMNSPADSLISFIINIFWTIDIPFSFLSGIYDGGVIEMRPAQIARNYLRRWFIVDIFIVVMAWLEVAVETVDGGSILGGNGNLVRMSKTLRLSRLLRLFRLLRLIKVPAIVDNVCGSFHSQTFGTFMGIFRSLALIAIINHFIACSWYAVSSIDEPENRRWSAVLDEEGRGVSYRYSTSLHWSLTQFTPASMEVVPRNTYERFFAIVVLFSALVCFSAFVSSITTSMTALIKINSEKSKERESIRKYISDNQLSIELGNKIDRFLRSTNYLAKKRLHEADIPIFKDFPETLRRQLHWEVYNWRATTSPIFYHYSRADQAGFFEVCHRAMREESLHTGQELFVKGAAAGKAYFFLSGVMEYSLNQDDISAEISDSQLVCEVVLWVKWHHQGDLRAAAPSEFVALDSDVFRKIGARKPHIHFALCEYASHFRERLLESSGLRADVWNSFDTSQELAQKAFANLLSSNSAENRLRRLWRTWSPRTHSRQSLLGL